MNFPGHLCAPGQRLLLFITNLTRRLLYNLVMRQLKNIMRNASQHFLILINEADFFLECGFYGEKTS
jgi:hypothetical protein